jgi:hypothetical protein
VAVAVLVATVLAQAYPLLLVLPTQLPWVRVEAVELVLRHLDHKQTQALILL